MLKKQQERGNLIFQILLPLSAKTLDLETCMSMGTGSALLGIKNNNDWQGMARNGKEWLGMAWNGTELLVRLGMTWNG